MTNLEQVITCLLSHISVKSVTFCCEEAHLSFDGFDEPRTVKSIRDSLNKAGGKFAYDNSRYLIVPSNLTSSPDWHKDIQKLGQAGNQYGKYTIALRD